MSIFGAYDEWMKDEGFTKEELADLEPIMKELQEALIDERSFKQTASWVYSIMERKGLIPSD